MYLDCGRKQKYSEKEHKRRKDINNSLSFYDVFTFSEQTVILPPNSPCFLTPFSPPSASVFFKTVCLSRGLSGCTLNRQDVRLTLHYEKGFTVTREPADLTGGAVLYRYPYEKLKMSADDGIRNLYLDFGGPEGEMVSLNVMSEGLYLHLRQKPDIR